MSSPPKHVFNGKRLRKFCEQLRARMGDNGGADDAPPPLPDADEGESSVAENQEGTGGDAAAGGGADEAGESDSAVEGAGDAPTEGGDAAGAAGDDPAVTKDEGVADRPSDPVDDAPAAETIAEGVGGDPSVAEDAAPAAEDANGGDGRDVPGQGGEGDAEQIAVPAAPEGKYNSNFSEELDAKGKVQAVARGAVPFIDRAQKGAAAKKGADLPEGEGMLPDDSVLSSEGLDAKGKVQAVARGAVPFIDRAQKGAAAKKGADLPEGEGMFPDDSVLSEITPENHREDGFDERSRMDVPNVHGALEGRLQEALARCRIIEDDRDQLEKQVRELRLKADLEAQARQEAEMAREAAEEELRYRATVQDKTDSQSHSRIAQLEAMVRSLQGQLEEIEEQEGTVADLKDRVTRAERLVHEKDAQFERIQKDLERRLAQQQQLISKNRQYMEAVGRRKLMASQTLNNALNEMRNKRKESDHSVETLESLVKRVDQFMSEETSRLKEVGDIRQTLASLRGTGAPNLEMLEQLEIKLRQERDGAQQDFVAQRRLEDELLAHAFPRGPAPAAVGPYASPLFVHDMGVPGGGYGDAHGYGMAQGGYGVGHQPYGNMYDGNMQMMGPGGMAGMQNHWGGMGGGGMGGGGMGMGPGQGWGVGGGGGGVWPMGMGMRPDGGMDYDKNRDGFSMLNEHSSVNASVYHEGASHAVDNLQPPGMPYGDVGDPRDPSPQKDAPARGNAGGRLPPVSKAAVQAVGGRQHAGAAKPGGVGGAGGKGVQGQGGPRVSRFKEAGGGAPGGQAPSAPGKQGDRKEELRNARQKEIQAKAAERRTNR